MNTAEQVFNAPYPDFHWPLNIAKEWLFSDEPDLKIEAVKLLDLLEKRYPHAPQIGQVAVLGLIECGRKSEAVAKLRRLERILQNPDEETLSRWARLFREQGEAALAKADKDPAYREIALEHFRNACRKYHEAYEVRHGHYPLINEAELYLVKASLEEANRADYRKKSRELAIKLLASRPSWPATLQDDNIWHLATEAQAHMLLGEWTQAADKYEQAATQINWQPFHAKSICNGLIRTRDAISRLAETIDPRFDNPQQFFAKQGTVAGS